tara:strand:- start:19889 stop:20032 length:144 start_codon:yes stop_codon:yes gene_type:complete
MPTLIFMMVRVAAVMFIAAAMVPPMGYRLRDIDRYRDKDRYVVGVMR